MKNIALLVCLLFSIGANSQIYTTINGDVDFISDAPLEIIQASSDQMQGVLDMNKKTFAFKMYIKSFEGFNNYLQQVHIYENYMEANEYPIATFKGKILEQLTDGQNTYRAKGTLNIHGLEKERIIEVQLDISDQVVKYTSVFTVPLKDHDIQLPKIVYQKIAEEIAVTVNGEMKLKE